MERSRLRWLATDPGSGPDVDNPVGAVDGLGDGLGPR